MSMEKLQFIAQDDSMNLHNKLKFAAQECPYAYFV